MKILPGSPTEEHSINRQRCKMIRAEELHKTVVTDWKAGRKLIPREGKDHLWTKWVKDYFDKKGQALGYKVERTDSSSLGKSEYLVDLCWWKEQDNQWWLEMALESEWLGSEGEIDHDFCKLIDIKAYLKIWVCSYGDRIIHARKSKMCHNIASGKLKFPEEQYLILNFPDSQKEEDLNRCTIHSFWIDAAGNDHPLPLIVIEM